ncbi:DNA-binding GntR family transcriptional regulator [Mesorhizobium soli]|uniref:GntR family transcriptional regulator n=1 Tax=Pseudaminobacter soli (ex Li et al. 2025) TaxID=1295366 RepID=UPI0024743DE1|nr:GntR family transcriptional regulator [Mesorhizobium soli]MDH6234617.1 DNA-binding GntR family transcriptional regulator [Mesorhizobium soli]
MFPQTSQNVEYSHENCDKTPMAKHPQKPAETSLDLSQKAYLGIRQMLFHNEIVAGQKVPFKDLADQMDMSVTPVIQALKYLEFQGLVRREPNKGYFIEALKLEEVDELYKFRKMLELILLEETIATLDQAGIAELQTAHDAYLQSLSSNLTHQKLIADMNFHLTIARLAKQPIRLNALKNVFDILHLKYKTSLGYVTREQSNQEDHGLILDSIVHRDEELAKSLLSDHIENSKKHAYLNLQQMINEKAALKF